MEPLNPNNEEQDVIVIENKQNDQDIKDNATYVQVVNVDNSNKNNNNESHAMLAMENDHICYIDDCNQRGVRQCAGLRYPCITWMCNDHGVNAKKQHWCGGGGCGLRPHDKYCQICAKKANKESWMKLALILSVLILIVLIIIFRG